MADVNLFVGGEAYAHFPAIDASREYKPVSMRIAAEYAGGTFAIGWPLNPKLQDYQHLALLKASLEVGDIIRMYEIPEMHVVRGLLVRVVGTDSRMDGAALKPVAQLYDKSSGEYEDIDLLDSLFENLTLVEQSTAYSSVNKYFVEPGKSLVMGFKVTALPTDTSQDIANMVTALSMVASVDCFDIPHEV